MQRDGGCQGANINKEEKEENEKKPIGGKRKRHAPERVFKKKKWDKPNDVVPLGDLGFRLPQEQGELSHGHLFVDTRLVLDLLGSVAESQSGNGLVAVPRAHRAADDEGGAGVSSKRVLQQARQFRVAIWNVHFLRERGRGELQ